MVLAVYQIEYHLNKHQHSEEFGLISPHPRNWVNEQSFDLFMTDNSMEQSSLFHESNMSVVFTGVEEEEGFSK